MGIPDHSLETIEKDHPGSSERCKEAMVKTLFLINPSATWKDVMEAVGKLPDVAIAQTIKNVSPDKGKPHPFSFILWKVY